MSNGGESSRTSCISTLKNLDNLLKCGICYEYLNTALITPCSHNYCSYCIRKSLMYRTQCPSCFEETTESQLRNNRVLDEIVAIFSSVKDIVIRSLANGQYIKSCFENSSVCTQTKISESNSEDPGLSCITPLISVVEKPTEHPASSSSSSTNNSNNNARISVSPKKDVRIPSMFSVSPRKQKVPNVDIPKVPCPVCSVEIPERNINMHLDACLKRSQEKCTPKNERRKPLPKLVYQLVKEKELRKKLSDLGLPSLGDRNTLINRHKRYTLLYNSECDSLNPRPVSEIIKQLKKEEDEEKKVTSQSGSVVKLNVDRRADPKVNEEAQRQYLEEHKTSFKKLIESIQRNKQMKKEKNKLDVNNTDEASVSDSSEPKEIHVISIDETSSENSDIKLVSKCVSKSKRKRILSENEDISEVSPEIRNLREELKVEASVHSPREKKNCSPPKCKKSSKKGRSSKMLNGMGSGSSIESNEDLALLTEMLDNVSNDSNSTVHNGGNVTPAGGSPSKACTSLSSPVLSSKRKANITPSAKSAKKEELKREGTPDMFEDDQKILESEKQSGDNGFDSDCSSNDSVSLMVYQGPESLSQDTPVKEENYQMSPVYEMDPEILNQDISFSLGIDSILPETEDFMKTPVKTPVRMPGRRQSTRTKEKNTDFVEPCTRSLRKRAKK